MTRDEPGLTGAVPVESSFALGDAEAMKPDARYLQPTRFLDSDSPRVRSFAARAVAGAASDLEKSVALYYAVRDGIRYDPYAVRTDPAEYQASTVAALSAAFCIQKAILLGAAARAIGVPSRLGFADVRNHLTSAKLRSTMGSDLFVYHGFTELHLEGKWVKATPAFNLELCRRFGVRPLEFDGRSDSIFHEFDAENRRHMEYVRERGSFAEFPFEEVMIAFRQEYPALFDRLGAEPVRDEAFRPTE